MPPFDLLMALREIEGLRINSEQAHAFRPGSRRVDYHSAGIKQMEARLSFACPICGRKQDYNITELVEGAVLTCPFCKLTLTLRGHMWEDVQKEIRKIKGEDGGAVTP